MHRRVIMSLIVAGALAAFAASSCSSKDATNPVVEPAPPPAPPPPPLSIGLEPTALAFNDTAGTASPPPLTVAVSSASALTGLSAGPVSYGAGASGWLTASLGGTTTPAVLTLTAASTGLAAGSYSATVPVSASAAANSPQHVTVTLSITAAPPPPPPPPPPPVNGYTVLLTGNMGDCGSGLAAKSAALVASVNPQYLFVLGDNAFARTGKVATLQDYRDCYDPQWGRFRSITWAAVGDHDQDSAVAGAPGAEAYFNADRIGPAGKNYYSFNIGNWHVVVLNVVSGGPLRPVRYNNGSEQLRWLRDDLRANYGSGRCTLAVWHDPMWISSSDPPTQTDPYPNHGYRDQPIRGVWIALYEYDADVVVNGGRHIYERFAPMRYDGSYEHPTEREFAADAARGIRQFSSGLAGDGPLSTPSVAVTHPLSEYRSGGNGLLKLTLGNGGYSWEFMNTSSSTIQDAGNGTCH